MLEEASKQSRRVFLAGSTFLLDLPRRALAANGPELDDLHSRPSITLPWTSCRPGPWGELEYARIVMDVPEPLFPSDVTRPRQVEWFFGRQSRDDLASLLESVGLAEPSRRELLDERALKVTDRETRVQPSDALIVAMPPAVRARLYSILAKSPQNRYQYTPYAFSPADAKVRLQELNIPGGAAELFTRLTYRRGNVVLFADKDVLMRQIPTREARLRAFKALTRFPAHLVRLRLDAAADLDRLESYWFSTDAGALRSLLQAIVRTGGGTTVDVATLLSRFGRERLYMYPHRNPVRAHGPDCFWTAGNYFRARPDDAFFDSKILAAFLQRYYRPIEDEPRYGDIALFSSVVDDQVTHAAIYVADDILFTKNGSDYRIPWLLNSLDDLKIAYGRFSDVNVRYYRHATAGKEMNARVEIGKSAVTGAP